MITKIIFTNIIVGLLYLMSTQSTFAIAENHNIPCDPSTDTCATIYFDGAPTKVIGKIAKDNLGLYVDYTTCASSETHFTDIFLHGLGTTGEGTGYNGINGCFDPLNPGNINFSTELTSTVTNSYTTWLYVADQ